MQTSTMQMNTEDSLESTEAWQKMGVIQMTAEDTSANCHFTDLAWKTLLKKYNNNSEFLSVPALDTPSDEM